jgi:hypothetical protein
LLSLIRDQFSQVLVLKRYVLVDEIITPQVCREFFLPLFDIFPHRCPMSLVEADEAAKPEHPGGVAPEAADAIAADDCED